MLKTCIVQNLKNDLNKHNVHCRQRFENHDDVQFVKFFNVLVVVVAIVVVIAFVVLFLFICCFDHFNLTNFFDFDDLVLNENVYFDIRSSRDNDDHNECISLFK